MNQIKKYMNTVEQNLHLPHKIKLRIMTDLASDVQARLESGKSYEEVIEELGAPEEVAASFYAEFEKDGQAHEKKVWPWAFLAAAGLCAAYGVYRLFKLRAAASIGIIGGADGPTAIFITTSGLWPSVWPLFAGLLAAWLLARAPKTGAKNGSAAAAWVAGGGVVLFGAQWVRFVWDLTAAGAGTVFGLALKALLWPQFWLPLAVLLLALARCRRAKK